MTTDAWNPVAAGAPRRRPRAAVPLAALSVLAAALLARDGAPRAYVAREDPAAAARFAIARRLAGDLPRCAARGEARWTRGALAQPLRCADGATVERPVLVARPSADAVLVRGAIAQAYQSVRWAASPARPLAERLGAPLEPERAWGAARVQRFEFGAIAAAPAEGGATRIYLGLGAAPRPTAAKRLTTDAAISALADRARAEGERAPWLARLLAAGGARYLGGGRVSVAWLAGSRVFKLVQPGHPYGDFVPALDRALDESERAAIARETVDVIAALRADPAFVRKVGLVVPAARWLGGGWVEQALATGARIDELGLEARRVAAREITRARDAARRVVVRDSATGAPRPPVFYDWNVDNFRFHPDGTIAAWFDPGTPSLDRPWGP